MINFLRFVLHEPLLTGAVTFCLLLVGGLVLSDWAEKRRTRNLLKMRDELKELHRQGISTPVIRQAALKQAVDNTAGRPAFRLFRWEFALLSAIAVALVIPRLQEPMTAKAKSQTETADAEAKQASSVPTPEPKAATPSIQSENQVASGNTQFLDGISLTLAGTKPSRTDLLSFRSNHVLVDCAALFEENADGEPIKSSADGEFRKNYSVRNDTFADARFGRR